MRRLSEVRSEPHNDLTIVHTDVLTIATGPFLRSRDPVQGHTSRSFAMFAEVSHKQDAAHSAECSATAVAWRPTLLSHSSL